MTWAPLVWVDPKTERFYIKGHRVHHGLVGAVGLLFSFVGFTLSLGVMIHDWKDRPWAPRREVFLAGKKATQA